MRTIPITASLAAAAALVLAGCSSPAASGPAASADPGAPATPGLITEGTLTVGIVLPDAPYMIPDENNVVQEGITKELLDAVAAKLGLDITFLSVAWEGGIAGVEAGRYDVFAGSLYDTLERQEVGTFVDFMQEQTTLVTTKDNAAKYSEQTDACGHTIATIRGTTDVIYAQRLSDECVKAGLPALEATEFPTQQDSELAMQSGRTDFGLQSVPAVKYEISNGANKATVGDPFEGGFYVGGLMNSGKKELVDAVLWAETELYDEGTTKKIFDKYGVAPVEPGINLSDQ